MGTWHKMFAWFWNMIYWSNTLNDMLYVSDNCKFWKYTYFKISIFEHLYDLKMQMFFCSELQCSESSSPIVLKNWHNVAFEYTTFFIHNNRQWLFLPLRNLPGDMIIGMQSWVKISTQFVTYFLRIAILKIMSQTGVTS